MKLQGKNVAHAAIADDLFLQRQFPQGSDWLEGEAVINKGNKCRLVSYSAGLMNVKHVHQMFHPFLDLHFAHCLSSRLRPCAVPGTSLDFNCIDWYRLCMHCISVAFNALEAVPAQSATIAYSRPRARQSFFWLLASKRPNGIF